MKLSRILLNNLYIIIFILNASAVYFGIRNGVFISLIITLISTLFILNNKKIPINKPIVFLIIFVFYNLIAIFISFAKGFQASQIISEFSNAILPMIFVYLIINISDKDVTKIENSLVILILLSLITGIYLNYTLSTQSDLKYIEFLDRTYPNFYVSIFIRNPRLTSYFGSVLLGTISLAGIAISYNKLKEKYGFYKYIFIFSISSAMCFLTFQRSAYLGYLLMNIIIIGTKIANNKIKVKRVLITITIVALLVLFINIRNPQIISSIISRINDFSGAVSERDDSWLLAFQGNFSQLLFGNGFAMGGQRAIGINDFTINDGNYFKMLYELGFIGVILFLLPLYLVVRRAIKQYKTKYIYLGLLIAIMIQAIGSNVYTFMINAIIFWSTVGLILRNKTQER